LNAEAEKLRKEQEMRDVQKAIDEVKDLSFTPAINTKSVSLLEGKKR
jgi:hypothetical protein